MPSPTPLAARANEIYHHKHHSHHRGWPRDCYYIVHGAPQFVPPAEIRAIVRLLLHWQRPDGMVPKHFSGGGGDFVCWGPPPEADAAQFAVLLADEYYQRSGDTKFVAETLPAAHAPTRNRGCKVAAT